MNKELDLYFWKTPNGMKVLIALEEMQLSYRLKLVNIGQGEQFTPSFLTIAPNNRIPALVDHTHNLSIFESGAILMHLAETYDMRFYSENITKKNNIRQWLFWQMGGLGPMAGQKNHFKIYAPKIFNQTIPYAIDRYVAEVKRLYGVMNSQLEHETYLAGDHYSIADMASYPWIYEDDQLSLGDYPNLKRWVRSIQKRDAVIQATRIAQESLDTYTKQHGEEASSIAISKKAKKLFGTDNGTR